MGMGIFLAKDDRQPLGRRNQLWRTGHCEQKALEFVVGERTGWTTGVFQKGPEGRGARRDRHVPSLSLGGAPTSRTQ